MFILLLSAKLTLFIFRHSFIHCSFARATYTVYFSLFLRSLFICPCGSHRLLFVFCSSFVRLLFVFCSSFVRLLFVFCSSFVRLFIICLCGSHYLPVVLRLSVVLRAHTLSSTIGIIGIIVLITDIVNISFSSP